jgi:uncharacterized protein
VSERRSPRGFVTLLAAFAALGAAVQASAQAGPGLRADSGRYIARIQGAAYATDTFTSDADGGSESDIEFTRPGRRGRLHISVHASGGRLRSIETTADPEGRFRLSLDNGEPKLGAGPSGSGMLPMHGVALPADVLPFCSLAPEQLRLALASYDLRLGGAQAYDVIYSNGLGSAGLIQGRLALSVLGAKPMQIAGKAIAVTRCRLTVPSPAGSLNAELFADSENRILLYSVPSEELVVVREGCEDLARPNPAPEDPTLSAPVYKVKVERDVKVLMRDGVALAADVYRPDAVGRFPVVLQRTCRGRENVAEGPYFARRGYVFVAQDVRGRFDSDGEWRPWIGEASDGYDTVEWCAHEHWSTGSIAMIGAEYDAYAAWAAARSRDAHLTCLICIAAPAGPFSGFPYARGPLALEGAMWWSGSVEGKREPMAAAGSGGLSALATLPVADVDKALFGRHLDFLQEWLRHPTSGRYWEQASLGEHLDAVPALPVLHVGGWFQRDWAGAVRNFQAMIGSKHKSQRLIVGPWSNADIPLAKAEGRDYGSRSVLDLDTQYLRWLDHWLKGVRNNVEMDAPVEVYVTGADAWRAFSAWPPREASQARWYLHSGGGANSDGSNGVLSREAPAGPEPDDRYAYDPARPFIPESMRSLDTAQQEPLRLLPPTGERDVLSYVSAELDRAMLVAGPAVLHLTAETSARDTDWFAALEDVGPDGSAVTMAQGILSARFRKSVSNAMLLGSGEIAQYTVTLDVTARVVAREHRLRLLVTSSCFPLYSRNLNTGLNNLTTTETAAARQTVYHSAGHASFITLSMLPY